MNLQPITRNGFSLVEVVIGFCIIAASSVIFFQTVHLFKKETTFYSEHFIASAMLEKVMERSFQETDLNPHGLKALGLESSDGSISPIESQITDGQSVFFQHPSIDMAKHEQLFSLLNDNNFVLGINATKEKGYFDIVNSFKWQAKYGSGESEAYGRILNFTGEKEVETDIELDDSVVEKLLVKKIYDLDGVSLSSKFNSINACEVAMNTGHIYFTCFELFSSADFQNRCKQLESDALAINPGATGAYAAHTQKYFVFACDLLHVMVAFEPRLKKIHEGLNFIDTLPLREKSIMQGYILKAGSFYQRLRSLFLASLLKMIDRYEQQINSGMLPREQRTFIIRLFNLYRIIYVNREFFNNVVTTGQSAERIKSKFQLFLVRMREYFADRDSSIERMAAQERGFINQDELARYYFLPDFTSKLFTEIDRLANLTF